MASGFDGDGGGELAVARRAQPDAEVVAGDVQADGDADVDVVVLDAAPMSVAWAIAAQLHPRWCRNRNTVPMSRPASASLMATPSMDPLVHHASSTGGRTGI